MTEGERDYTFFAVEEPEAHLHPHVQRLVYRYFLISLGKQPPDAGDEANHLRAIKSAGQCRGKKAQARVHR